MQGHRVVIDTPPNVRPRKHARQSVKEFPHGLRSRKRPHAHQHANNRTRSPHQKHTQHGQTRPAEVFQVDIQQQQKQRERGDVTKDAIVNGGFGGWDKAQVGFNSGQDDYQQCRTNVPETGPFDQPLADKDIQAKYKQNK